MSMRIKSECESDINKENPNKNIISVTYYKMFNFIHIHTSCHVVAGLCMTQSKLFDHDVTKSKSADSCGK